MYTGKYLSLDTYNKSVKIFLCKYFMNISIRSQIYKGNATKL